MTNYELIKKIAKNESIETIRELLEKATAEINAEEEKYKKLLPVWEYGCEMYEGVNKKYPEWVNETFDKILKETGLRVVRRGEGRRYMAITNPSMAKYIIYDREDEGKTLLDVIEVLLSAPSWCGNFGLSRSRMEMVFHILVLHKENRKEAKAELKRLLQRYDPTSLKVLANEDEAFRGTLNCESQMIMFVEREICKVLGEETKFRAA